MITSHLPIFLAPEPQAPCFLFTCTCCRAWPRSSQLQGSLSRVADSFTLKLRLTIVKLSNSTAFLRNYYSWSLSNLLKHLWMFAKDCLETAETIASLMNLKHTSTSTNQYFFVLIFCILYLWPFLLLTMRHPVQKRRQIHFFVKLLNADPSSRFSYFSSPRL